MNRVGQLSGAVALLFVFGVPATAAPPAKPCNLVRDPAGDATFVVGTEHESPAVDLLSGDFGSDGKVLTAVVRLRDLSALDPTVAPGVRFKIHFGVGKSVFLMQFRGWVAGDDAYDLWLLTDGRVPSGNGVGSTVHQRIAKVTGDYDEDRSEVRIHAPLSAFRPYAQMTRGERVTKPRLVASREQGYPGVVSTAGSADTAESAGSYALGAPSCVVVGA